VLLEAQLEVLVLLEAQEEQPQLQQVLVVQPQAQEAVEAQVLVSPQEVVVEAEVLALVVEAVEVEAVV
jgi:hypothetical protein